jgi:DNA-directed RNA polymerase specialized sigma24 family protein
LLRELPDRQRIAAALRYGADLTEVQIAQIMRVRRSTVSSALEAARSKLGPLVGTGDPPGPRPGPAADPKPNERSRT